MTGKLRRPEFAPAGARLSIMGSYVIDPPPLAEYDGETVAWQDWRESLVVTHIDPSCEECGDPGPSLTAWGLMTYTEDAADVAHARIVAKKERRPFARRRGERKSWKVSRLVAFVCPSCLVLEVYDRGSRGVSWSVIELGQPSLFDSPSPT